MKRWVRLGCVASVVVFLLLGAACKVELKKVEGPPPIRGEPEFGGVKLATEIDQFSKEPVVEVTSFAADVRTIYAAIKAKNVPAGAEFRFQWRKADESMGGVVMSIPVNLYDNWVSTSLDTSQGVPPGEDWSVEVKYNGEVVSTASFSVTPPPKEATTAIH
jgi:hypothetical protein